MTFDEWWETLETRDQRRADKEIAIEAYEEGRLEAAEHILEMWKEPWPVTEARFIDRLNDYVEKLK